MTPPSHVTWNLNIGTSERWSFHLKFINSNSGCFKNGGYHWFGVDWFDIRKYHEKWYHDTYIYIFIDGCLIWGWLSWKIPQKGEDHSWFGRLSAVRSIGRPPQDLHGAGKGSGQHHRRFEGSHAPGGVVQGQLPWAIWSNVLFPSHKKDFKKNMDHGETFGKWYTCLFQGLLNTEISMRETTLREGVNCSKHILVYVFQGFSRDIIHAMICNVWQLVPIGKS